MRKPETFFGIAQLHRIPIRGQSRDPWSANVRPPSSSTRPLPSTLLDAAADALRACPDICLRAYGDGPDPSLEWLARFDDVRCLALDLRGVTSFEVLASLRKLERLGLGETASTKPSLGFLSNLSRLQWLGVGGHWRDFDAVAELAALRHLGTHVGKGVDLRVLSGHQALEVLEINFGTSRDLSALADLPQLRSLEIYQVERLDEHDLAPLGDCRSLVVLSLGALRNVRHLGCLCGRPSKTLRYVMLEKLQGLKTLAEVGACEALEELYTVESKPADGRLDLVANAPSLQYLGTGHHYSREQRDAALAAFRGRTLWTRGTELRGDAQADESLVAWRRPVGEILELADAAESGRDRS